MYAKNLALPHNSRIVGLFESLFGRRVTVRNTNPRSLAPTTENFIAVYLNEHPRISGVLVLDPSLAIRSSVALSLFPAHRAEAYLKSGMDESLMENLREVCNVATSLFQDDFMVRVRLTRVFHTPEERPAPLFKLLKAAGHRKDIQIDIEGYGSGLATLLVA